MVAVKFKWDKKIYDIALQTVNVLSKLEYTFYHEVEHYEILICVCMVVCLKSLIGYHPLFFLCLLLLEMLDTINFTCKRPISYL
jgi:hypothetical protein